VGPQLANTPVRASNCDHINASCGILAQTIVDLVLVLVELRASFG
jgi:hypothetical protein